MNRVRFRWRVGAAATLLIGAFVLVGCGGGGSSSGGSDTAGAGTEESAAPESGGTLTMAQGEEVTTLDPQLAILPAELNVVSQISEPLWRENTDGKLVPWLVEKVKTSQDEKVYTLTLKKGIRFSTGQEMTSADVLFTLEAARKSDYWESLLAGITKLEAPNPQTVVIANKEPAAELPTILSQWSFGIEPKNLSGKSTKEFASDPIGTGPFKLGPWKRGESLTLEKNPYYWQQGKPYLDKIEIKTVTDPNSRVSQLQGGQLELIYSPPWTQVEAIEASPETDFGEFPLGFLKVLQMNGQNPLFQNKKIREAVNISLDREGMVNAVLHGKGEPAGSFVPPPIEFHDPSLKAPEQDVEKAKELVAEAVKEGANPGFTLSLPNEDDFWVNGAQIVQQNLEEVGFKVKISKLDTSTWFENLETGKYDLATGFIYSAVPTPTEIFGGYNAFEGQFTKTDTTETEKLFSEALAEPDKAKRQQLYYELQEFVNNEQYVINVVYEPFAWAFRNSVQGLYVGNVGIPWLEDAGLSE